MTMQHILFRWLTISAGLLAIAVVGCGAKSSPDAVAPVTATEIHADNLPESLATDAERALYLTAGGKYTEADIKANGGVTASQKFKGVASSHDMFPKAGDRICPVTQTKANARFTWIIDGSPYQFCCPPCVDEFVKIAKERPDELKEPDAYIKAM